MAPEEKTILILIWNMDIGGVQKRTRDIISYLNQHCPNYKIELLIRNAYPTSLLKQIKKLKNINIRYRTKTKRKLRLPSIFWMARNYLLIRPNIVLTFLDRFSIQMATLKLLFFWHKVKLVLNESIYTSLYLEMYENFFWKLLVKIFYPLADTIIVPTKAIQKDLNKNFNVSLKKIFVVPHWTLFRLKKINKKIYDFIYIGRLEKEKNIFVLLDLIKNLKKQCPKISLCILGKGSLKRKLLIKIKRLSLVNNIFFYGFRDNVKDFLIKSKILLLPSSNEGMPNCVLEAAVYKVPSVVYNFKGADEVIIHQKTGFIAKNKKVFFQYSKKLLNNQQLRKIMGENAQKRVLNSFGENNLKKFIEVLLS